MTPVYSWPITSGGFHGKSPWVACTSVPQMPAVWTLTSTWPGPAVGSGTSSRVKWFSPCQVAALMIDGPPRRQPTVPAARREINLIFCGHVTPQEVSMRRSLILAALTALLASPALGPDLQGTLKKISDSKTISLGYRETAVPFSFVGADKQAAGFTVDLCRRVAGGIQQQLKLADLKINWVPVTSDNRIQMVANGTIDLECGTTTQTLRRSEQVDFSLMTFVDGGSFLVRADSGINVVSDLTGKKVAVIPGTTTETALNDALRRSFATVQIVPVKDHANGLSALESGAADAYASDRTILIGLAVTSKDPSKLALSDQGFSYEPYGLVVRRNDSAFRLAVNRVLADTYRGTQIVDIYNKWFGAFGRPSPLLQIMYLINAIPE